MKTIFSHLRDRLLFKANLAPCPTFIQRLPQTEWSSKFETLQRNRLLMGALRYGPMHNNMKSAYDRTKGIEKRLAQYRATGNTECLVDIANLAMLEFEEGAHPNKHFNALSENHSCV